MAQSDCPQLQVYRKLTNVSHCLLKTSTISLSKLLYLSLLEFFYFKINEYNMYEITDNNVLTQECLKLCETCTYCCI